jgi:hypothetical protein
MHLQRTQTVYDNYPLGKAVPLSDHVPKYRAYPVLGPSVGVLLMACYGVWETVSKVVEVNGDPILHYEQEVTAAQKELTDAYFGVD